MNDKFKTLNGKHITNLNKKFSVYNSNMEISDAINLANEIHKNNNLKNNLNKITENIENKKINDLEEKKNDTNKKDDTNKIDEKSIVHPTYELSDEELKRRIEISKKRNKIALDNLNEHSTLDELLSGIINDLIE